MSLYRVRQFVWAITSNLKPIDNSIVKKYLDEDEEKLFNKLSNSEKQHSIRVCNKALSSYNRDDDKIDKKKLAKIALLHDVGKSFEKLNAVDKSILVLLDKITNGSIKKYSYNKKVDVYYNHAKKSVNLLKDINKYDTEFLEAIEKHHYNKGDSNIYLKIIKESDDQS